MINFIQPFSQITKNDVAIAGGKGASLGEMLNSKISVPPGFVVLAPAFDKFLRESPHPKNGEADLNVAVRAQLDKVNYNDINSVDRASNVIRDLIHDSKMPDDLRKEILLDFKKLKKSPLY